MLTAAKKPPIGTPIYILTLGGENRSVTTDRQEADNWLGAGEDADYQVLYLRDYRPESEPTGREMPAHELRRTQELTDTAQEMAKKLEQQGRKFRPKSHLLQ